jgi:WD40 repeat protein
LPGYSFATVPVGTPLTVINPNRDELAFLDAATGRQDVILKGDMSGVSGVVAARDRKTFATFKGVGDAKIWHIADDGKPSAFPLPRLVLGVNCSPDGEMVATESRDRRVTLWDVASQTEVATFDGHLGVPPGNGFFPDSRTLACVTFKGVMLWDLVTRQPRLTLSGPVMYFNHPDGYSRAYTHEVKSFAIASDGRSLATHDASDRITVWDCATGQKRSSYPAPGHVQMMHFSPDSSQVWFTIVYRNSGNWLDGLIGRFGVPGTFRLSAAKETIVFDAATGMVSRRMPGFGFSNVLCVTGNTLATLSESKDAIQLWDLPPSRALHPFVVWTFLGMAFLFTGSWCYAGASCSCGHKAPLARLFLGLDLGRRTL